MWRRPCTRFRAARSTLIGARGPRGHCTGAYCVAGRTQTALRSTSALKQHTTHHTLPSEVEHIAGIAYEKDSESLDVVSLGQSHGLRAEFLKRVVAIGVACTKLQLRMAVFVSDSLRQRQ